MFFNRYRGGMLTGSEIVKQVRKGNITIDPFSADRVNPNSYNLTLNPTLKVYTHGADRDYLIPAPKKNKEEEIKTETDMRTGHVEYNRILPRAEPELLMTGLDSLNDINAVKAAQLEPLDAKNENEVISFIIPEEGYVLHPGILYLGRTNEFTGTDRFIPMINGRSSGGRLGISIHVCAGFGDVGFHGTWTLEITAVEPVRIYPNQELAQISFHTPYGKIANLYDGKYKWQIDPGASRMHYDFIKSEE